MKAGRDLLLPPVCLLCGERRVEDHASLCLGCWGKGRFIARPYCWVTGVPFSFEWPEGMVSRWARLSPPIYDHARAVLRYESDFARPLILQMKYGDRPEIAERVAVWLRRATADILPYCDMISPVPLHWRRLWGRRFNQAAELARVLARLSGKEYVPDVLRRVRPTRPQIGLGRVARRRNMRGAFLVHPRWCERVKSRAVLLVDDVMTSGATMDSCVRALRKAGCGRVDVAVLARVIHEEEMLV